MNTIDTTTEIVPSHPLFGVLSALGCNTNDLGQATSVDLKTLIQLQKLKWESEGDHLESLFIGGVHLSSFSSTICWKLINK
jgi:hypothetical protein